MLKVLLFFNLLLCVDAIAQENQAGVADTIALPQIEAASPMNSSTLKWKGEFSPYFSFEEKPSSRKGYTQFDLANAFVELDILTDPSGHNSGLHFKFDFTKEQQHVAYGRIQFANRSDLELQVGLLQSRFSNFKNQFWNYDFLKLSQLDLAQKFAYTEFSDQGLAVNFTANKQSGVQFLIRNGEREENEQATDGPGKDAEVFFFWKSQSNNWIAAFSQVIGKYENIDVKNNVKESSQVWFSYQDVEKGLISLSYIQTKDSVDGAIGNVADQVDLTDLGGQTIQGQGYTLAVRSYGKNFSESLSRAEFFAQQSFLQPVKQWKDRTRVSTLLGASYKVRPSLDWIVIYSNTNYAQEYSSTVSDTEAFYLISRFFFE